MNYQEMRQAVGHAENTLEIFDSQTASLAKLMVGNLRSVSKKWSGKDILIELKRELSQFNAKTGEWKN